MIKKIPAWKAQMSILLVAMFVGFAPFYHAVCVAVASEAASSGTATTMLMPDGTVMTHGIDMTGDTGMATAASAVSPTGPSPVILANFATSPETSTLVGSILLVAGIVILAVVSAKLVAQLADSIVPRGRPRVSVHSPSPASGFAWRGPPPKLAVLCISRT